MLACRYCDRSDSFSLGCALWSLLSGCKPWPGCSGQVAAKRHVAGDRLPKPTGRFANEALWELISELWTQLAKRRPTASEAHSRLREIRKAAPPPQPLRPTDDDDGGADWQAEWPVRRTLTCVWVDRAWCVTLVSSYRTHSSGNLLCGDRYMAHAARDSSVIAGR